MSHAGQSIAVEKQSPRQNRILGALPAADYERLLPHLKLEPMPLGWAVYEADDAQGYAYFPTAGIVSKLYVMQDGSSAEIAVVGNEGAVGIALYMGGGSSANRAVVQSAGHAYRLKASILTEEFERSATLQHSLLRYTQALMTQMAQTAVCNRHHSVDQQLCRWLLLSLDRLKSNELVMTQELIANMLGVRREGVTNAAGKLQADGLIHYRRGKIVVLDRPKLEARTCECYTVVKREYDRLLGEAPASLAWSPVPSARNVEPLVSLEAEEAHVRESLREFQGEYVPLELAAAAAFHATQRNSRESRTHGDYDGTLDIAAAALSRLVPIYTGEDPLQGQVALSIDIATQRFANGATEVHCADGRKIRQLAIRRSDMLAAISLITRTGLPFASA